MAKSKILKITWRDHFHTDGWLEFNQADIIYSDVRVHTVGFLMGEDKLYIHLAQSVSEDEDGESMQIMSILKQQIIDKEYL